MMLFSDIHLSEQQKRCLISLVEYLHIADDATYYDCFQLFNYKSAGHMYLNMAAVRALELFSVSYDEGNCILQFTFELFYN